MISCNKLHATILIFGGDGIRTAPKRQSQHTIKLQPQSSLYMLGQVMCANMYHRK